MRVVIQLKASYTVSVERDVELRKQLKASYTVSVERDVELRKLSYERATVRTDVTRKCKLQASFYYSTNMVLHLFFTLLKHCFFVMSMFILMFFNSIINVLKKL